MSRKPTPRTMNLAARLQLAVSPRNAGSEVRRNAARDRILRAGFWQAPALDELKPSAQVVQLYPVVATRRAPTLNP